MNAATASSTRMTPHVPAMLIGLCLFAGGYVLSEPWLAFLGVALFFGAHMAGRRTARPARPAHPALAPNTALPLTPAMPPQAPALAPRPTATPGHSADAATPVLRLRPIVPLHSGDDIANWLGGRPYLPADTDWPILDGKPALFLGQFNLAHLPADIWQGHGPRTGWLVVFLSQSDMGKVTLLHTTCFGTERDPPGPLTYPGTPAMREDILKRATGRAAIAPRWPIEFRPPPRDATDQHERHTKHDTRARLVPDARPDPLADAGPAPHDDPALIAPGLIPFDWNAAMILFAVIETNLEWQRTVISALVETGSEDPGMHRFIATLDNTLAHVDALKQALTQARTGGLDFSEQLCTLMLTGLGRLKIDSGDRFGADMPVPVLAQDQIRRDYLRWLDHYARTLYCASPDALPASTRAHFEPLWTWHALHERGWVGGDLAAHFASPDPKPARAPIPLLRLQSSDLMGWVFANQGEFCILIDPDALSRGDFSAAYGRVSA